MSAAPSIPNLEQDVHRAINAERIRAGLRELSWDGELAAVARAYCEAMAEEQFLSHHSPVAGQGTPADRVRAAGLRVEGVGENLARLSRGATASDAVEGWMRSRGHRENLLTPEWETGGVGVAQDAAGDLFFAHLFAVPAAVELTDVALEGVPVTRYLVRAEMKIGRGRDLVGFVRNRYAGRARTDPSGTATLEVEVARGPGRAHLSLGWAERDATNCIALADGWVEIGEEGDSRWVPGWSAEDAKIVEHVLLRQRTTELLLRFTGFARRTLILTVDGVRERELAPGEHFTHSQTFCANDGLHRIHIGVPVTSDQYRVARSFVLDTQAGTLQEERA